MKVIVDDTRYAGVTYICELDEGTIGLKIVDPNEPPTAASAMPPETARALAGVLVLMASEIEAGR